MLEAYIRDLFHASRVHSVLVTCITHCLSWLEDDANSHQNSRRSVHSERKVITNMMASFHWLIQFIVTSQQQEAKLGNSTPERTVKFAQNLHALMEHLNRLMDRSEPTWIKVVKGKVLKNFSPVFNHLALVFDDASVLGRLACGFLNALPVVTDKNSR
jgi:hypothetical protein